MLHVQVQEQVRYRTFLITVGSTSPVFIETEVGVVWCLSLY